MGGSDGLDTTAYEVRVERHFGIVIRPAAMTPLLTLGDLASHIVGLTGRDDHRSAEQVWTDLRQITSGEFGVDPGELTPQTRFVEDLNC